MTAAEKIEAMVESGLAIDERDAIEQLADLGEIDGDTPGFGNGVGGDDDCRGEHDWTL